MTTTTRSIRAARTSRWITILTLTLATTFATAAPEPEDPFVTANTAAARGDHAAAARAFERVIAEEGWSANTLIGLANAYASTGDHGRAVLALERAKLIAPRDRVVLDNLARLRETAALDPPPVGRTETTLGMLTADTWSWLSLAGLACACASVVAFAWTTRRRRALVLTSTFGGILAVGAGVAAHHVAPPRNAVVVIESEAARIAPFDAAEQAFSVRAGERGLIEQRRGDFVYVRIADERVGWLPASALESLVPSNRRSDAG